MAESHQFITEMLRGIQASISDLHTSMREQLEKVEQRIAVLERRQSAAMHFDEATIAHLASIHGRMDAFRAVLTEPRAGRH